MRLCQGLFQGLLGLIQRLLPVKHIGGVVERLCLAGSLRLRRRIMLQRRFVILGGEGTVAGSHFGVCFFHPGEQGQTQGAGNQENK